MSVKCMANVWEHSQHKGSALLLMLAIADFAKDDGTGAWPSVETLAAKMRMTSRNTQLLLRKLEASGELRIDPGAGPHGTHLYAVVIAGGEKISGVKNPVRGGEKMSSGGVKATSPNPLKEPSVEPPYVNDRAPAIEFESGTVMAALKRVSGKLDSPMSKKQLNELATMLMEVGRTYDDVRTLWLDCTHADKPIAAFVKAIKENDGLPYGFAPKQTSKGSAAASMYERYFLPGTGWIEPARPDRTG